MTEVTAYENIIIERNRNISYFVCVFFWDKIKSFIKNEQGESYV